MTPEARIGAAIDILDRVLDGSAAEQVLTSWARANRFAGSGDRATIRDLVYDALRCRRSFVALAGASAESGRALMIGAVRAGGGNPEAVFTGAGHAPSPMSAEERTAAADAPAVDDLPDLVRLDCPDWLAPDLQHSLGPDFEPVLSAMRQRAPVILRVNAARSSRKEVLKLLAAEAIAARPHPLANFALEVIDSPRKIKQSKAYAEGLVELQDASPQAAVEALPLRDGMRILDYCAGGGGKILAVAARASGEHVAHDADPRRMRDLPARARRAGVTVDLCDAASLSGRAFDLVVLDVPCSGTGTWRRTPEAKWTLTPARLAELSTMQSRILDAATTFVAPGGAIAYMTCSLLDAENRAQIDAFLRRTPGWRLENERRYTPLDGGDGFYSALLTRV